jgi:hypothetical protein
MSKYNKNSKLSIDLIAPNGGERHGTSHGRGLSIGSVLINTSMNAEPNITFSSDRLIAKIKKRRIEKLNYYKQMLKYCYDQIESADNNQCTDITFTIIDNIPECKEYNPIECLEYVSTKLREEYFDTTVLNNTTMFITWKYLELKKELVNEKLKRAKEIIITNITENDTNADTLKDTNIP